MRRLLITFIFGGGLVGALDAAAAERFAALQFTMAVTGTQHNTGPNGNWSTVRRQTNTTTEVRLRFVGDAIVDSLAGGAPAIAIPNPSGAPIASTDLGSGGMSDMIRQMQNCAKLGNPQQTQACQVAAGLAMAQQKKRDCERKDPKELTEEEKRRDALCGGGFAAAATQAAATQPVRMPEADYAIWSPVECRSEIVVADRGEGRSPTEPVKGSRDFTYRGDAHWTSHAVPKVAGVLPCEAIVVVGKRSRTVSLGLTPGPGTIPCAKCSRELSNRTPPMPCRPSRA